MRKRGYIGKFANVDLAKFGQIPARANERFSNQSTISLKRRILSIAFLGIAGFVLYLAVTLTQSRHNEATLQDIQKVRYPAQARLLGALHNLEIIQREIEAGVLTRDEELIRTTAILADEFRQNLFQAASLTGDLGYSINSLLVKFENYYRLSSELALEVTSKDGDIVQYNGRAHGASIQYDEVARELQTLLDSETEGLSNSLGEARTFYQYSIMIGYAAGLSGAFLIFMLGWYTANSIVKRINEMVSSLRNIAKGDSDMSVRIKLSGKDEMTELAFWFNTFIARLDTVTRKSTAEIRRIAYTDNLSGLPNRRLTDGMHRSREGALQG